MLRFCGFCKKELDVSCFNTHKKQGYARCISCVSKYNREYQEKNKEKLNSRYQTDPKVRSYQLKRYQENKEIILIKCEEYRKANLHKYAAKEAKRRSKKLNATPKWITKDQVAEMENFYWLAKDLEVISGQKYHVDHIVPLQGKNVCGLHVPWNLQVLPSDINLSKQNKHPL